MPKLRDRDVERNQEKIEAAALRLFIGRGFYGTSVRDIAQEAGVSLGNIYNYYRTKEQLFSSLVRRYDLRMAALQEKLLTPLLGEMDPARLKREFGRALVFWGGGVATQKTLAFGTPAQVYSEVRERVEIFNRDGGFVFDAIHNIQGNTPTDNILAMFRAIADSGR